MMLKKEKTPYRREAVHIMVWCLLAVVVLAVISFNPADPTLFHFSTQASTITNWCGLLGAQLAGLLFYLFGSACYALLLLVVLPIYRLLIKEKQRRPLPTAGRVLALVLTVATLGGLYHLDLHAIPAGGLVGGLLAQGAQWLLGGTGSLLLSWSLVWVQLVILLQVPLMPLVLRAARTLQQHMMRMLGACAVRMRAIFSWRPAVKQQEATDDFADVLLAAGATKVAAFEEEQGSEQAPSPALESKLAQVPVHREPSPTQFLKATFNRLPNTRLHVNPFAADEHGAVPYEKVLDVYHAEKRKAFLLPDASFFAKPAPDAHEAEDAEVTAKRAEKIKEKLRHF
ncbi:hypothetical protein EBZ39_09185, partial [bacterium]|nr:hypothetical protein [bacterium]